MGLQPGGAGLQPGVTGTQPGCMGLQIDGGQLAEALRGEVDRGRVLLEQRGRRVLHRRPLAGAQQCVDQRGGGLAVGEVRRQELRAQRGRGGAAQHAQQLLHRQQPHRAALVRQQPRARAQLACHLGRRRVPTLRGADPAERSVVGEEVDLAQRLPQWLGHLAWRGDS